MRFCLDFQNDFCSGDEPLEVFENLTLDQLKELYRKIQNSSLKLVGFLSYEWGAALEGIKPENDNDALKLPRNWFGLYKFRQSPSPLPSPIKGEGTTIFPLPSRERVRVRGFQSSFTKENYLDAVQKILTYLKAGDCYQVNLTQRFTMPTSDDPWQIYRGLREISPAPYACFLDAGNWQIASASPECFLKAEADGTLTTKPIKGTRRRGQTPEEDAKLKEELQTSAKDRAELLMITDLERNDLGKVCLPGSVRVTHLQNIETFAQVHHLVSTIQGQRRNDCDIIDCLAAMIPGGSITGCPKIRAMEIIRELEGVNRGVYTGVIGWLGPHNTCHFNIAIRTIVLQKGMAYYNAGGGIVIDSDPEAEYEETLTKAKGMRDALCL